jgi:predicted kinase
MYVLVNGAFGVGKTSVARELRRLLPGAVVFDPEWVGFVLMRLPGYRAEDYQQLAAWRRLTLAGARAAGILRPVVLLPMAFSDESVLAAIRSGLAASGRRVAHFCLTAPPEVVRERLAARARAEGRPVSAWAERRALECCAAHRAPGFAVHVATEGRPPRAVALDLAAALGAGSATLPAGALRA